MPYCCVPLCKARCSARLRKEKLITFHRFPNKKTDGERRKKWIENINRDALRLSKFTSICSSHFLPEMFDRTGRTTRLREYALPTVFECSSHPVKHPPETPSNEFKPSIISETQQAPSLDHSYYIADSPRKIKRKLEGQIKVLTKKLKTRQTRLSKYKIKIKSMRNHMKKLKNNMYTITRNF